MRKSFSIFLVLIFSLGTAARGEPPLPAQGAADAMEIEPPLLIKEPAAGQRRSESREFAVANIPQLEAALARATRSVAEGDALFKTGILAREEIEQRALAVIRIKATLEQARLEEAKQEAASARSHSSGTLVSEGAEKADAAVAAAAVNAQAAVAAQDKAELEAAKLNLQRRLKLRALGAASKAEVSRAEEKLAALKNKESDAPDSLH